MFALVVKVGGIASCPTPCIFLSCFIARSTSRLVVFLGMLVLHDIKVEVVIQALGWQHYPFTERPGARRSFLGNAELGFA